MKESEVWEYLELYCEDLDGSIVFKTEERKRKAKGWKRDGEGVEERTRVSFVHGDLYESIDLEGKHDGN